MSSKQHATRAQGKRQQVKRIIGKRNANDIAQAAAEKAERVRLKALANKAAGHVSTARSVPKINLKAPGARRKWL